MQFSSLLLLLLISAASSFVTQETPKPIHRSAALIANYSGPFPTEKLINVDDVYFVDCHINFEGVIKNVTFAKLKKMTITNCVYEPLPEVVRQAFPNLETLVLKNNKLKNFTLHRLNAHYSLKSLQVEGEDFNVLESDVLNKLARLKELSLVSAKIHSIEKNAFNGLENLEVLNLRNNLLTTLNKETLAPLRKLRELILKNNILLEFGTENLPHMPELISIDLSLNPISRIDVEELKKLAPKLKDISTGFIHKY